LDVDRNAAADTLTDGLLILRYLFEFRGQPLVKGLVDQNSARSTPATVLQFLDACRTSLLDVDADGQAGGMTDGLLILRYLADFRGPSLINGVVAPAATRSTPDDIAAFLQSQMPPSGKSGAKSAAAFAQQSADEWFGLLGDAGQELHRSTLVRSRRVGRIRH
jgi:hypothetical protein